MDLPTSLLLVLAVFCGMTFVLCVGYGVLSAFPDEAIERVCRRVFGA